MSVDLKEVNDYVKKVDNFKLPEYRDLPTIPLYMEQVVSYVNEIMGGANEENADPALTAFMVNNYVKAKIISAPEKKKYNQNHLGYLICISFLKNVVSLKDLAAIIAMDKTLGDDKAKLYKFFKDMQDESLKNQTRRLKMRVDAISRNNKNKKAKDQEDLMNLTYLALKLYVESETTKLLADNLMRSVTKEVLPEVKLEKNKKGSKLELKASKIEAQEIGKR